MPAATFALDDPEVLPIKQLSRRVFPVLLGNGRRLISGEPLVASVPSCLPAGPSP
jgi:hypothetical protein